MVILSQNLPSYPGGSNPETFYELGFTSPPTFAPTFTMVPTSTPTISFPPTSSPTGSPTESMSPTSQYVVTKVTITGQTGAYIALREVTFYQGDSGTFGEMYPSININTVSLTGNFSSVLDFLSYDYSPSTCLDQETCCSNDGFLCHTENEPGECRWSISRSGSPYRSIQLTHSVHLSGVKQTMEFTLVSVRPARPYSFRIYHRTVSSQYPESITITMDGVTILSQNMPSYPGGTDPQTFFVFPI